MTALNVYKFVKDNNLEYHWDVNWDFVTPEYSAFCNHAPPHNDVILFVPLNSIAEFNHMMKRAMEESGVQCRMKYGYFCFWMKDICDFYDLDINEIFEKE